MVKLPFFATCPRAFEDLLVDELRLIGVEELRESVAGVAFHAPLADGYRVVLWSRIASRLFHPIARVPAATPEELRDGAQQMAWEEHFGPDDTFAVDCTIVASKMRHTDYAALLVKDGIVDRFRSRTGRRPNVDARQPSVSVNLHIERDVASFSIDIGGGSLHRRGYRSRAVAAPLKENAASGMLARARWAAIAAEGGAFIDPMCGSGTLLIEAALIAGDIAPGLLRGELDEPPQKWQGNSSSDWTAAVSEARSRAAAGRARIPVIRGYDLDPKAVSAAHVNIEGAGLSNLITVARSDFGEVRPQGAKPGLIAMNPPYGQRIGSASGLESLYERIGRVLSEHFDGWNAAVLAGDTELARTIGLRASKVNTVYNGTIRCALATFELSSENRFVPRDRAQPSAVPAPRALPEVKRSEHATGAGHPMGEPPARTERSQAPQPPPSPRTQRATSGIPTFVNRMIKNRRLLGRWAERTGITCYRLYDADLPEYAVAIDLYEGQWLHVQEYVAPQLIDPDKASQRLDDIMTVLPETLGIAKENVFLKRRERHKRSEQYGRLESGGQFYEVHEGGRTFLANFTDYIDTGIFLDHRLTRDMIRRAASGARFLNLFSYTATASVYAASGGALSTLSIDSSNTYLRWARENFVANGIGGQQHRLDRADCWEWLHTDRGTYDLIFLDPPTFSNAKGKRATLDVQRDHVKLIGLVLDRLSPEGTLLFSTNFRRFRFETEALERASVEDITSETIPRDFQRNRRIHQCYRICHKGGSAARNVVGPAKVSDRRGSRASGG